MRENVENEKDKQQKKTTFYSVNLIARHLIKSDYYRNYGTIITLSTQNERFGAKLIHPKRDSITVFYVIISVEAFKMLQIDCAFLCTIYGE